MVVYTLKESFTSKCNQQSIIRSNSYLDKLFKVKLSTQKVAGGIPRANPLPSITASLLVFLPQPAARLNQCSQGIPGVLRLQWIYLGRRRKSWQLGGKFTVAEIRTTNIQGKNNHSPS